MDWGCRMKIEDLCGGLLERGPGGSRRVKFFWVCSAFWPKGKHRWGLRRGSTGDNGFEVMWTKTEIRRENQNYRLYSLPGEYFWGGGVSERVGGSMRFGVCFECGKTSGVGVYWGGHGAEYVERRGGGGQRAGVWWGLVFCKRLFSWNTF